MKRRALVVAALSLLAGAGCASLEGGSLWVLPPLDPPPTGADDPGVGSIAAFGSSALVRAEARWSGGTLELSHVLTSVEEAYPLLSIARRQQIVAEAEQLAALGAFDLGLKAGSTWSPEGFYEHNTAQAGLEQATGLWGLRVWGGYRLGAGDFDPTYDGKRVTNHGGEFALGAKLPLLRGGSIDGARRDLWTSTLGREIAASELASQRLSFERSAAQAYWAWVEAGARLSITQTLLGLAEDRQRGVQARAARGDISEIDALDNERLVVRRRALLISARRGLEKAAIALSLFLRDGSGAPLRPRAEALPRTFPEPAAPALAGLQQDLQAALRARPDLRQIAQERGQAAIELAYAENLRLPQVDLSVTGSQDLNRRRPSQTKGEFELTAGLEFSFPIQNRRARGKALASRTKLEQLEDKERFLREKIEAEVRDAVSALEAAFERVSQARRAARLAERLAEAERRRFELGDSNVLILNLREEAAAEAELREVSSLSDYWAARAMYRAAVGAPVVVSGPSE